MVKLLKKSIYFLLLFILISCGGPSKYYKPKVRNTAKPRYVIRLERATQEWKQRMYRKERRRQLYENNKIQKLVKRKKDSI